MMYRENAKEQTDDQVTAETEARHWRRVLRLTALRVAVLLAILFAGAASYRVARTPKVVKPTGCYESAQVLALEDSHDCPAGARAEIKQVKVKGEDAVVVRCKCLVPPLSDVVHHDGPLLDSDGTECWIWEPLVNAPEGAVIATHVQTCTSHLPVNQ